MLKKLKEIKEGWIKYLTKNPDMESIAANRAEICANCPIFNNNFCSLKRGGCGCYIPAKVFCEECKCPKNKW